MLIWNCVSDFAKFFEVDFYLQLTFLLFYFRADLESHGDDSNVGLSYKSDMCSKNNKCSVNEDTGLDLGLTIAHELGHR